ncbi:MAG: DUF3883 domain-containing protein [Candidatus Bathyarchaeia archaeon]
MRSLRTWTPGFASPQDFFCNSGRPCPLARLFSYFGFSGAVSFHLLVLVLPAYGSSAHSKIPRTGEIRFIEVKGRWPIYVAVELRETEYEYGKRIGNNYWLYVVYGFSTDSPRLLAIRGPINKAKWRTVEVKKYRLVRV